MAACKSHVPIDRVCFKLVHILANASFKMRRDLCELANDEASIYKLATLDQFARARNWVSNEGSLVSGKFETVGLTFTTANKLLMGNHCIQYELHMSSENCIEFAVQ